ncbi:hypothetical protein HZC08_01065 [Candidatus Micrarchaeota archaeon]|nr:hypothetical protein [Candidatus Micrarchaeota archaeon]
MLFERPRISSTRIHIRTDTSNPDHPGLEQKILPVLRLVRAEIERLASLHGTNVKNKLGGILSNFVSVSTSPGEIFIVISVPNDLSLLDRFLDSHGGFREIVPLVESPQDRVKIAVTSQEVKACLEKEARKGTPLYEMEKILKDRFEITLTDRTVMALMQQLSCLNTWARTKERRLDLPRPVPRDTPATLSIPKQKRAARADSLPAHVDEIAAYISAAAQNGGCTRENVVAFVEAQFGITTTPAYLSTLLSTLRGRGHKIPRING